MSKERSKTTDYSDDVSGLKARVDYLHKQLLEAAEHSSKLAATDPSANTNLLQVKEAIDDAKKSIDSAKEILDRNFGGLG